VGLLQGGLPSLHVQPTGEMEGVAARSARAKRLEKLGGAPLPVAGATLTVLRSCMLREGVELDSGRRGVLQAGQSVVVLETAEGPDRAARVRVEQGWISTHTRGGQEILVVAESPSTDDEVATEEAGVSGSSDDEEEDGGGDDGDDSDDDSDDGSAGAGASSTNEGSGAHVCDGRGEVVGGAPAGAEPYILPPVRLYQAVVDVEVRDEADEDAVSLDHIPAGEPVEALEEVPMEDGSTWLRLGSDYADGWTLLIPSDGSDEERLQLILPIQMEHIEVSWDELPLAPRVPLHEVPRAGEEELFSGGGRSSPGVVSAGSVRLGLARVRSLASAGRRGCTAEIVASD
jgi:hypothetical protein